MATTIPPYIPSFLQSALDKKIIQLTFSDVQATNITSTSSFLYDNGNAGLKNTQQLNVDWSKFENHTFFSSAEAKVNLAFEQVINGYPFDGSRSEVEAFFEKLTGFDRYVFDNFPKFKGQLGFSSSWITVKDHAGALYPAISKNHTGDSVINPKDGSSFTLEAHVFLPVVANGLQVIFQKASSATQGLTLCVLSSSSTSSAQVQFSVVSGSSYLAAGAPLTKGTFNHVCAVFNRDVDPPRVDFFVNEALAQSTTNGITFNDLDIDGSDVLIGSGSLQTLGQTSLLPQQTFSGSLDEVRVFHSVRSLNQQLLFARKAIYALPDLVMYYRFNEPPPPLAPNLLDQVNSIVLDSSGNSLHAVITNFTGSLRQDASADPTNRMIYEKAETLPVLFPAFPATVLFNSTLLASATLYDAENPNLITRLVPQHYLLQGSAQDGSANVDDPQSAYNGTGMPGQAKLTPAQVIVSFLYIWARFFDEIKLFVDAFSTLRSVDYGLTDNVPNNFLYDLVRRYGFHLPPLFNESSIDQYVNAENIGQEIATSAFPLKAVQNELLRRVLINMPDVIRSKGTQHAIKSFFRAVGIDPDNSMRIREFGGPTTRPLSFSRERKMSPGAMVEFVTSSLAISPYLSASRVEVGFPAPKGTMVQQSTHPPHGISNCRTDGYLTSGSWTVEGMYRYTVDNVSRTTSATQSLGRLCVTGSNGLAVVANALTVLSLTAPKVLLYVRSGDDTTSPLLRMEIDLPGTGFMDQDRWSVSFGCSRNDSIKSDVSSSYFLRVAKQEQGDLTWHAFTSSFFYENPGGEENVFRESSITSASGSFFAIGENQQIKSGSGANFLFLNNISTVPGEARSTAFTGRVSNLRFWSRDLSEQEWTEHVRNFRSLGTENPLVNYNFVTAATGSWGRVRLDTLTKQDTRQANATASLGATGSIAFLDFSLNNNHLSGTGFPQLTRCVVGEIFDYSYLSPYFDEASTSEKIRIRGYLDQGLVDSVPWASVAPVHEIVRSEQPTDDVRFSIEFSLIDSLNRDIVTLFSTFDAIDNALGSPELVFSPDYPDLERLRDVYFNRISGRINFQNFFDFFRWFDKSLGTFVEQLIPRKTNFKGTNFVIESHMLERNKLENLNSEIYLAQENRSRIMDVLLLQFIEGSVRKYL